MERHDEATKRRALDDLYAVESSALPPEAARAQARIALARVLRRWTTRCAPVARVKNL